MNALNKIAIPLVLLPLSLLISAVLPGEPNLCRAAARDVKGSAVEDAGELPMPEGDEKAPLKLNKQQSKEARALKIKAEGQEKTEKKKEEKVKEEKSKVKEGSPEDLAAQALEAEYQALQKQLAAMLKTVKTPFTAPSQESESEKPDGLGSFKLAADGSKPGLRLSDRLLASRLYLPGRLVIGKPTQFTVKGKPGYWAAVAMADRDSGAKPIYGRSLRLGPDRKVVALGKIPEGGVLALKYFAPVEGDLIGQSLYFEAALWPDGKPEAVEIAQTVSSEAQSEKANGILVTADTEKKKGVRLVPDSAIPPSQRSLGGGGATLDSGKP
ncbi:MAG: hypothetical protein HY986_21015 [Candidatus Melainabacteria bacterium]|nr:hypothetical protein [Candidatus Melainabacteria bacterium]